MSFAAPSPTSDAPAAHESTPSRNLTSRRFMNIFRQTRTQTGSVSHQESNRTTGSASLRTRDIDLGGPTTSATSNTSAKRNKWALFWYYSVYPGDDRKLFFLNVLGSWIWRALLLVLTFILLFGAQIRDILIPPQGDTACDAIFMATFVIFIIDMLMRMDCEPTYFLCRCRNKEHESIDGTWFSTPQVGSFLFWCDLLSTMTLLTEISFINKIGFSEASYFIQLDQFGIPWNGLDEINQASPIELDLVLLVTICKTARVARFIRSNTALKVSSKVNWFWLLNLINPCWYFKGLIRMTILVCDSCVSSRRKKRMDRRVSTMDDFSSNLGKSDVDTTRRSSWAGLGLGALAALRDGSSPFTDDEVGVKYWPIKTLRFIGLAPVNDNHWRRHVAAIKIQRLWRRYKGTDDAYLSERDVGWKPRGRASSSMERALQKRSFMKHYSVLRAFPKKQSALNSSSTLTGSGNKDGLKGHRESQVGTAMRELTGQRVALGIIIGLLLTVLFTYTEVDATRPATMIVLHNQTSYASFATRALTAAMSSSIPDLYSYELANGEVRSFPIPETDDPSRSLRPRETLVVTIAGNDGRTTIGKFALKDERQEEALVALLSTIFILVVWFFGVTAFAGPVMVLVVIPIERMVRLLGMLMVDPLGYENSPRYKKFMKEEDQLTKNTRWTKEVLKGMETSFLMSTILRIGSLMKVGFGSAGVEIIRNNLEKGQNKNNLALNSQGSSVSCIFLFCDIRQFTDATECLQEEVFVFTNRIAAVVHSISTAYGGSANKNIGDAFLLSWLLDDADGDDMFGGEEETFTANNNQADKALLSVVKICMALHYDDFYISTMSDNARTALLTKLAKRKGPVVQMGFGLHAGKAVQGAIGSQRKIDATYISDHVEQAEFLESSTKKYGVNMLMSDSFHRLLHPSNRRRCRKVDQLLLLEDDDDFADDYFDDANARLIELFTFDMDIDALWRVPKKKGQKNDGGESDSDTGSQRGSTSRRDLMRLSGGMLKGVRRRSVMTIKEPASEDFSENFGVVSGTGHGDKESEYFGPSELVLPTGPAIYNANVWVNEDMRKIRQRYSDGLFFQKFSSGLQAFYSKDWEFAKQCFQQILDRFEDGPSRNFMNQIEEHGGVPPKGFKEYGTA